MMKRLVTFCLCTLLGAAMADTPLNESIIHTATQSALATYNYDALSSDKQLARMKTHFTEAGWTNFEKAMRESGNLTLVKENQMVVSAYKSQPASIESYSKNQGINTWVVRVPAFVTYSNQYHKVEQQLDAYVTVVELPNNEIKVANINSVLTAPEHSASALPVPRKNCNMVTN
jgi:sulfite reductase beta subunit-like hemoprotein